MAGEAIVAAIVAGAVLPAIILWWWYWDRVHVRVRTGTNDADEAAQMFIRVLNAAKETLVVHDDGDKVDGTVYEDEAVIDAVRRRLAQHEALTIKCLFNDQADLALTRKMRTEFPGQFQVWYRNGPRPIGDIHYKIADGGTVGHLSAHGHREPERNFKLLDCSGAKRRTRKSVFGKYLNAFERETSNPTVAVPAGQPCNDG